MAKNRYRKDYILNETADAKGRIRTSVEYVGPSFSFAAGEDRVHLMKKLVPAVCVIGWAAYIGGMIWYSTAMRTLYAALPYVFCALPLFFMSDCAAMLHGMEEPLSRRQADRMNNRYPASAMFLAVLSFFALAGEVVRLVYGFGAAGEKPYPGDYIFILCAALLFMAGIRLFQARHQVAARENSRS